MIQSHKRIYALAVFSGALVGFGLVKLAGAAEEERRCPPPEAISACENQVEGSECKIEFRGRTITGTCVGGPEDDDRLACMPEGGRPPGPPPEAFDACDGADEGDACSVDLPDHTVAGTCRTDKDDASTLVCIPERPNAHRPQN